MLITVVYCLTIVDLLRVANPMLEQLSLHAAANNGNNGIVLEKITVDTAIIVPNDEDITTLQDLLNKLVVCTRLKANWVRQNCFNSVKEEITAIKFNESNDAFKDKVAQFGQEMDDLLLQIHPKKAKAIVGELSLATQTQKCQPCGKKRSDSQVQLQHRKKETPEAVVCCYLSCGLMVCCGAATLISGLFSCGIALVVFGVLAGIALVAGYMSIQAIDAKKITLGEVLCCQ